MKNYSLGFDIITENTMIDWNNSSSTLDEFNRAEYLRRLPIIICLIVLIVVGVVGNAFVLHIFTFMYPSSNRRCFILSLATLDLIACCICMPFEILENIFPYTFYPSEACRFFKSFNPLTSAGSAFVLIAIALDRYKKICHPMQSEFTVFQAKIACFIATLAAILVSWPAIILYGQHTVQFSATITGIECATNDQYKTTKYPFVYSVFLAIVVVFSILFLMVLYFLMWRQILRWGKFRVTFNERSDKCNSRSSTSDNDKIHVTLICEERSHEQTEVILKQFCTNTGNTYNSKMKSADNSEAEVEDMKRRRVSKSKMVHKSEKVKHKMMKTMFTITIVYILSFLPFLTIMFLRAKNKNNNSFSIVMSVIVRSFFINNIANPFIYGFWDREFREKLRRIFIRPCHRDK